MGINEYLFVVVVRCAQYYACSANAEKRTVVNHSPFLVAQYLIVYKCTREAWPVSQNVFQFPALVSANIDDAVIDVYTRIVGFNGAIDAAAFQVSADDIVSHHERNDLFEMKYIFDNHNGTITLFVGFFVGVFFFLAIAQFGYANAYTELLSAIGTFKNQ